MFVLRALTSDYRKLYYTGRAGDGWVSEDPAEAFVYADFQHAYGRAGAFNKYSSIHGLSFAAVAHTASIGANLRRAAGRVVL